MSARIKLLVPIDVLFERAVETLSPFDAIARWHPVFTSCVVEGRGVGAVRTLRMGAWTVQDRLDEIADGRGYRYTQLAGPLGAREHSGYFWVRRRRSGLAVVEWAARLSDAQLPEPIAEQLLGAIFTTGLAAAKRSLER